MKYPGLADIQFVSLPLVLKFNYSFELEYPGTLTIQPTLGCKLRHPTQPCILRLCTLLITQAKPSRLDFVTSTTARSACYNTPGNINDITHRNQSEAPVFTH